MPLSPEERKLRAQLAAHESWARGHDGVERTQKARDKFQKMFEDQVDPDRALDPAERARRAEHARKAHYLRMSLKAAQARRTRATAQTNHDGSTGNRRHGGGAA